LKTKSVGDEPLRGTTLWLHKNLKFHRFTIQVGCKCRFTMTTQDLGVSPGSMIDRTMSVLKFLAMNLFFHNPPPGRPEPIVEELCRQPTSVRSVPYLAFNKELDHDWSQDFRNNYIPKAYSPGVVVEYCDKGAWTVQHRHRISGQRPSFGMTRPEQGMNRASVADRLVDPIPGLRGQWYICLADDNY